MKNKGNIEIKYAQFCLRNSKPNRSLCLNLKITKSIRIKTPIETSYNPELNIEFAFKPAKNPIDTTIKKNISNIISIDSMASKIT